MIFVVVEKGAWTMTCKDCLHYEPCYDYGNILDPLHGGITCVHFKNKVDYKEVKHGKWIGDFDSAERTIIICSNCNKSQIPNGVNLEYCSYCGTKMDGIERKDK
jgi:hypothetical protein